MKKMHITISQPPSQSYDIFIGSDLINKLASVVNLTGYSKIVVVTDANIAKKWQPLLKSALPPHTLSMILPPGEDAKTIDTVKMIWQKLVLFGCDRKSLIITLGGGVISDMGGFAASTYMRGIDFITIPTTVLAQVDAGIGGKTGIDFVGIKNLIGTFHQPKAVMIDVDFLKTLPEREFISGFAEIIKHGLINDTHYLALVTSKKPRAFSKQELLTIITGSCKIKYRVIKSDAKEKGERKLLNFGHTVGHAVEALALTTQNPLLHGETDSIGMVIEAELSHKIGLLTKDNVLFIKKILSNAGLPIELPHFKPKALIEKMKSDKKNTDGKINFTLLTTIGKGIINQTVPEEIIKEIVTRA